MRWGCLRMLWVHPTFANLAPSSPDPFSQREKESRISKSISLSERDLGRGSHNWDAPDAIAIVMLVRPYPRHSHGNGNPWIARLSG